jgi:gas vesicle protein
MKQEKRLQSSWAATTLIGMAVGALIGLNVATLVVPASAEEDDKAGESPARMNEPIVRHLLTASGYTDITGLKLDGDTWKASALKDGKEHDVQVHAYSGAVTETPAK